MKKLIVPFLLSSLIVACSGSFSDSSNVTSGKSYPATNAESIAIVFEAPDREFTTIGIVESRGRSILEGKDKERAISALKVEAASIGADAIIVTSTKNETVVGLDGDPAGDEVVLSGKAIKYQ